MNYATKRTWAEISLLNLEHNYRSLRGMIPRGCRFLGVVKANAYGHGAVAVAKKLEQLGADYLAVACVDEGIELRREGIELPVLILGPTPCAFARELLEYRFTQTVSDFEYALELSKEIAEMGGRLNIHIKVDTGMSRLGFLCDEEYTDETIKQIVQTCALPGLKAEGVFTHFANADGDEDYTMQQLTRFFNLLDMLEQKGTDFEIRHCAASAAMLKYPCTHLDMVRPGIALYGHYPDLSCCDLDGPGLLPVMSLKSRVLAVRRLKKGTYISYGCTYQLTRDSTVAIIPVGYADGLKRLLSNRCEMLVGGTRVKLIGRVCMDMCMADVTDLDRVKVGDEVVVFGTELPLEEKADAVGTIQYELLCGVSPRVPRVYDEPV